MKQAVPLSEKIVKDLRVNAECSKINNLTKIRKERRNLNFHLATRLAADRI